MVEAPATTKLTVKGEDAFYEAVVSRFDRGRNKIAATNDPRIVGMDDFAIFQLWPSYSRPHPWWEVCSYTVTFFKMPMLCARPQDVRRGCKVLEFRPIGELELSITPCEPHDLPPWYAEGQPRPTNAQEVYFIQAKDGGPIKIGSSCDTSTRLSQLQAYNPAELVCLGVIREGGVRLERQLHVEFAKYRIRHEWFEPVQELMEYITANTEACS